MKIVKPLSATAVGILFAATSAAAPPADAPAAKSNKTVQLNIPSLGETTITTSQLHLLWNIKRGLHRIHSFHNPHALVCGIRKTHAHLHNESILFCESNRHWWERTEAVATGMLTGNFFPGVSGDAKHHKFRVGIRNYALFLKLMRNLPPESGTQNHSTDKNL